jgi:hypothetical protein
MTCMAQRASRLGLTRRAHQMARICSSMRQADPVVTLRQPMARVAAGSSPIRAAGNAGVARHVERSAQSSADAFDEPSALLAAPEIFK